MPAEADEEWTLFCDGPVAEVWIHAKCREELADLGPKDRVKIEACMTDMYCQMENVGSIPAERLNRNEDRHKVGHEEVRLQAFKHFQGRVYGVQGNRRGKRAFFASCAAVKKKDRADARALEKAVRRLGSVPHQVAGATI